MPKKKKEFNLRWDYLLLYYQTPSHKPVIKLEYSWKKEIEKRGLQYEKTCDEKILLDAAMEFWGVFEIPWFADEIKFLVRRDKKLLRKVFSTYIASHKYNKKDDKFFAIESLFFTEPIEFRRQDLGRIQPSEKGQTPNTILINRIKFDQHDFVNMMKERKKGNSWADIYVECEQEKKSDELLKNIRHEYFKRARKLGLNLEDEEDLKAFLFIMDESLKSPTFTCSSE